MASSAQTNGRMSQKFIASDLHDLICSGRRARVLRAERLRGLLRAGEASVDWQLAV